MQRQKTVDSLNYIFQERRVTSLQGCPKVFQRRFQSGNPRGIGQGKSFCDVPQLLIDVFEVDSILIEFSLGLFIPRKIRRSLFHRIQDLRLQFMKLVMKALVARDLFHLLTSGFENRTKTKRRIPDAWILGKAFKSNQSCRNGGSRNGGGRGG